MSILKCGFKPVPSVGKLAGSHVTAQITSFKDENEAACMHSAWPGQALLGGSKWLCLRKGDILEHSIPCDLWQGGSMEAAFPVPSCKLV